MYPLKLDQLPQILNHYFIKTILAEEKLFQFYKGIHKYKTVFNAGKLETFNTPKSKQQKLIMYKMHCN